MRLKCCPSVQPALVVTLCLTGSFLHAATPTETVSYGTDDPGRQKMHIYQAPGNGLKPLYIWAHPRVRGTQQKPHTFAGINMAHASKATTGMVDSLNAAGISVISWGSYPYVNDNQEFMTCIQDSFKMFEWVKNNAEAYGWDTGKIIIGGNSRGSIVCWNLAQSGYPGIIGIHSQQAMPDAAWNNLERWNPLSFVHSNSPPIYLTYAGKPNIEDTHDPLNGIAIINEYRKKGLQDRAGIGHTLGFSNIATNILPFCKKVISAAPNK